MSAQAVQMKQFVKTLKTLVDGGSSDGNGKGHGRLVHEKKRNSLPPAAEKKPELEANPAVPAEEVNPKQLIPLEEGDFSDF